MEKPSLALVEAELRKGEEEDRREAVDPSKAAGEDNSVAVDLAVSVADRMDWWPVGGETGLEGGEEEPPDGLEGAAVEVGKRREEGAGGTEDCGGYSDIVSTIVIAATCQIDLLLTLINKHLQITSTKDLFIFRGFFKTVFADLHC